MAVTKEGHENPYASPQANCVHDEDLAIVLRRAVMIFRRMGWGGISLFGAVAAINFSANLSNADPQFLIPMIIYGGYTLFFWSMLKTAKSLERDFEGAYRRARWTAIIAATFFFPFLTLPCYFAVQHLEECRRRLPVENHAGDLSSISSDPI